MISRFPKICDAHLAKSLFLELSAYLKLVSILLIDKKNLTEDRLTDLFTVSKILESQGNLPMCDAQQLHTLQNLCFWNCKISPTLEKKVSRPFITSLHFRDYSLRN